MSLRSRFGFGMFHYWASTLLALALFPALAWLHLPSHFDWGTLIIVYWIVLASQSIFVATLLFLLADNSASILKSTLQRMYRQKLPMVFLLLFFVSVWYVSSLIKSVVLTIDAAALIELYWRSKLANRTTIATSAWYPAVYLFAGFLLIFAYNDVILSLRFYGASDLLFNSMDKWLLHGSSVQDISQLAVRHLPLSIFHVLEFIYFGMFAQLGAGIILLSLCYGKKRGLQFVGTLLTAYYLALVIFYFWTSQGPYYLSFANFSELPNTLKAFSIQQALLQKSQLLWTHQTLHNISTDYYIAFPCMHITQPLILIWFLRRWKRVVIALCVYDSLLIVAIVLLQWHYVVDILAGLLLAVIAICMTDFQELRKSLASLRLNSTLPDEKSRISENADRRSC